MTQRESRTRLTSLASCLVVYERFATVACETIHISSRLSEIMEARRYLYSLPLTLTPCTKSQQLSNVADLPHGYYISAEEAAPKRLVLHDESFENIRSGIFFSSLRLALPHPHVETEGRTVLP